jgi:hypothetical protein
MPGKRRSSSFSDSRVEDFQSAHEVVAGRVYWLPEKADLDIELLDSTSGNDGHFGHPVVALWVDMQKNTVEVFIVSEETDEGIDKSANFL